MFTVIDVTIIGVRSRYHVRDSIGSGNAAHLDCYVPGFRSVVDFRQNVTMNVDHAQIRNNIV
jgi:hypothetical protein